MSWQHAHESCLSPQSIIADLHLGGNTSLSPTSKVRCLVTAGRFLSVPETVAHETSPATNADQASSPPGPCLPCFRRKPIHQPHFGTPPGPCLSSLLSRVSGGACLRSWLQAPQAKPLWEPKNLHPRMPSFVFSPKCSTITLVQQGAQTSFPWSLSSEEKLQACRVQLRCRSCSRYASNVCLIDEHDTYYKDHNVHTRSPESLKGK